MDAMHGVKREVSNLLRFQQEFFPSGGLLGDREVDAMHVIKREISNLIGFQQELDIVLPDGSLLGDREMDSRHEVKREVSNLLGFQEEFFPMGFLLEDSEMDARHEVKREVVGNCRDVDTLHWQHGRCNAELGVLDMVPSREYPAIVARAREFGFSVVNPRDHPYYPRVVWIEVDRLEQVAFLTPYYDGEIVLISVVPDVSPILYQEIVFHATAKGFIVLNTGPWKKGAFIPSDNAIFEAQLLEVETHISWEIRKREEVEASIDGMKNSSARNTSVLNLNAEEYADAKSISEAVIEAKRKKISQLRNRLTFYRDWIEKLKKWQALKFKATSEEEWPGSSLKSSEVFRSMIMVGDAFKLLHESHTKVESAHPESESVAEIEQWLLYDTDTSEEEWHGSPKSGEDFRSLIMVGDAFKLLHNSNTNFKSAHSELESAAEIEEKLVHPKAFQMECEELVPKLWRWKSMGISCLGLSILGFLYHLQAGQRKFHFFEVPSQYKVYIHSELKQ